ncbi:MAG: DUF4012 domain-containing protein [Candidatus Daviesbacteria bacterium]|nr:DUF4012 domain-containing protein [Candidatus Daviesbacteria bacterium]
MDESDEPIINKNSILLSRNKPVALVVGAAGFLGSHLVDQLLDKDIQVIGVDSKKENLREAAGNRNFHLILESAKNLNFQPERLDYLFLIDSGQEDLEKILAIFKKTKCRCLLVSSIDLYDKENLNESLKRTKQMEAKIAGFAADFSLNARVLRLGSVFGPRMNFDGHDPLIKLLKQSLTGKLQQDVSLEFSTRALFVEDAVELMIKTIFAGSTSQKIFDGVSPKPLKVAEIKQVLLDPVWYESRDFVFSELPPWQTPNLEKTIKFLNWRPKVKMFSALRQTLRFFKDNEIEIPDKKEEDVELPQEKKTELEEFRKEDRRAHDPKFKIPFSKIYLSILIALVTYALIWPVLIFGWGVFTFKSGLESAMVNLQKGEFEKSLQNIDRASSGVQAVKSISGLGVNQLEVMRKLTNISDFWLGSAKSTIVGAQQLLLGMKAVTGELSASPAAYFSSAQVELSSAGNAFSRADALLGSNDFEKGMPGAVAGEINKLAGKLSLYRNFIGRVRSLSVLLPNLVAVDGSKNYLILLQNNMELRPAGGFIGSFAKISFEGGKLKKLTVNDIYAIDGALPLHVEPPKEIKEDLGQKNWYLRDSNWESDFPTSARQAEWFYTKETGETVEGVIAMDVSAMEKLLEAIGPLNLPDYNEKITSENLFEKAVSHAEMSFFPGSQAKKSFLTALANEAFNKIFFLPQNNWPGVITALSKSLDEKHISIYINDNKLLSYADSLGWTHAFPRASKNSENQDFLSLVEANLGANKANYYLDRSYNLETVVGKEGEIKHRLRISYINRSPSDTFPGGKYKNRMRIYLPFGSKITRVLWGETNKTGEISGFVDYGRAGYSILLELNPKEQKTLVLDYTVPVSLKFENGQAGYKLNVVKQAGTLKDPFNWTITYPINYQLISDKTKKIGPQEQTISTDLSVDRSFEVEFKK